MTTGTNAMITNPQNTLHVRPVDGAKVCDPVTFALVPDSGRLVPNVSYWRRRLKEGVLERVTSDGQPVEAAPKPAAPAPKAPRKPKKPEPSLEGAHA